jgi:hypothetical protein
LLRKVKVEQFASGFRMSIPSLFRLPDNRKYSGGIYLVFWVKMYLSLSNGIWEKGPSVVVENADIRNGIINGERTGEVQRVR